MPKKKARDPELQNGEAKYIATVKLRLNWGRMEVAGGDVLILGPDGQEMEKGNNVKSLLKMGALVPYQNEEHAQGIRDHYNDVTKPARDELRQQILMERRHKRGQNSS